MEDTFDISAFIATLIGVVVFFLAYFLSQRRSTIKQSRESTLGEKLRRELAEIMSAMGKINKTSEKIEKIIAEVKAREGYIVSLEEGTKNLQEKKNKLEQEAKQLEREIKAWQNAPIEVVQAMQRLTSSTIEKTAKEFERKGFLKEAFFFVLGFAVNFALPYIKKGINAFLRLLEF